MSLGSDTWRSNVYTLLSNLLLTDPEPEFLAKVKSVLGDAGGLFGEMAESIGGDEEAYLALRLDFTKTLILYVHPYESVFLDPSGLLCGDVSVKVYRFYRSAGFEPDLASARVRCGDHLGVEMAFMAELVKRGDVKLQLRFLEEHLARWGPLAGLAISSTASTTFYKLLGVAVAHFILNDYEYLKGGGVEA
jgi:TorA maturation chaperone TorD